MAGAAMSCERKDWHALGGLLALVLFLAVAFTLFYRGCAYVVDISKEDAAPTKAVERVQGVVTRQIPVDGWIARPADSGLSAFEVTHERTGKTVVVLHMSTLYGNGLTTIELPNVQQKEIGADD